MACGSAVDLSISLHREYRARGGGAKSEPSCGGGNGQIGGGAGIEVVDNAEIKVADGGGGKPVGDL